MKLEDHQQKDFNRGYQEGLLDAIKECERRDICCRASLLEHLRQKLVSGSTE